MSQKRYILEILKKYGMEDCKPISTPLEVNAKFDDIPTKEEEMARIPFRSLMGSLLYIAIGTRPDIAFAVNCLSQYNNKYAETHWKAAKRILRYLKGTVDMKLTYEKTDLPLIGFADADWGNCSLDRRSFSGMVFMMSGGAITWESRKQRTVAASTTEAEYYSLTDAIKEALYLKRLFASLGHPIEGAIMLRNDNQGALDLLKNPMHHGRTKHIEIRKAFIREAIENKMVHVGYMQTESMPADFLTKSTSRLKHEACSRALGLQTHT